MKSALMIALACLLLAPVAQARSMVAIPPDVMSVAESNNALALKLYQQMAGEPGNLFFSPYSINAALGMTYRGAKGQTERQMAEVMGISLDQPRFHQAMGALGRHLAAAVAGEDQKLTIANALWVQSGYRLLEDFIADNKFNYKAEVQDLDFRKPAQAAAAINGWVDRKTESMIKQLVTPDAVEAARLVLTNAIYFQGKWDKPFKKRNTSPGTFHLAPGKTSQPQMMYQSDYFYYGEDADSQVLTMKYRGRELELVVILPKARFGLGAMEAKLTPQTLAAKLKGLKVEKVMVTMPRLKMTQSFSLAQSLKQLGMSDAFDRVAADFSGMTARPELMISDVIHKARLELEEEGTKAAAATAVVMVTKAAAPGPRETPNIFKADHPFVFMIRHKPTGAILFLGRVTDPAR